MFIVNVTIKGEDGRYKKIFDGSGSWMTKFGLFTILPLSILNIYSLVTMLITYNNKGERDKINLFENPGLAFSSPLYCTHLLLGALHSCINSKITIKGDTDEIDNFENLGLALFFYSILHIITPEPN